MKMKKNLFMIILPLVAATIVATTIGLHFGLRKPEPQPKLFISAQSITMNVGESKSLSYEVSIKSAIVKCSIKDEEIISLNGFTITANKVGSTIIVLEAQYLLQSAQCEITVTVNNLTETPEPPPDTEPENNFYITSILNCDCNENNLILTSNLFAVFKIGVNAGQLENYNLVTSSQNIVVSKSELGSNAWKIIATTDGVINVIENGKVVYVINVTIKNAE